MRIMAGKKNSFFSFIEMIAILLILAILTLVTVGHLGSSDVRAVSEAAIIKNHLRYAQAKSMVDDNAEWGIVFSAGSYTLQKDGSAAGKLPNESGPTHVLQGLTIASGTGAITFDQWGSPGIVTRTITLSKDGQTVTITKNTGFIP